MTSDLALSVGRVVPRTEVEGPGLRFAVWVQGCSIRCAGCFNPHLWQPGGGEAISPQALIEEALAADVEGVTLLGGEPFDQAVGAAEFASLAKRAGLSVMTFTGFTLAHLRRRAIADPAIQRLLDATDLLVDGPYQAERPDHARPWVGSTNQQFHFLTSRYAQLRGTLETISDGIEVRLSAEGVMSVNGWATVEQLEALLS